jgi:hypothetical protein
MKNISIIISMLMCHYVTQAQKKLDVSKLSFKGAYMSSVVSPGFKVGTEYLTRRTPTKKTKSLGLKATFKESYWTLNLGFYNQPDFHSNLYLLAEKQFRRQYRKGFFMDLAPGLGYSRTFLSEETYTLNNDGTVSKKTLAGYNYLMLSMAGSVGYDFSKTLHQPIKLYAKPSIFTILPFNSNKLIRPSYEIGAIFTFGTKKKLN